ncbi:hypothetical protein ACFWHT_01020 [Microbacterium sp. NPDC058342]|uniref:hypothetical protein n=1 Tax=Microbacterium sp. NPDC058342 TaxID=3346454 RepID=UPI0036582807
MHSGDEGASSATTSPFTRGWWSKRRLIAAGSIAGTMIGVLAIVVPIAVAAGDRSTSADTVTVDTQDSSSEGAGLAIAEDESSASVIEPLADGLSASVAGASADAQVVKTEWYSVPVDAPWAELWATPGACTTEIVDWLEQHGRIMPPQKLTSYITNTAATGSMAKVSRIRPQGDLTEPPAETVVVGAMGCTGAGEEGIYATMELGVDPVAVFHPCYSAQAEYSCAGSAEVAPIAGDPVTFDVAPGETRTVHLQWTQTMDFVGRFVATLEVDGNSSTIDLSPYGADLSYPAVTRPDDRLYFDIDGPWCQVGEEPRQEPCSLEAWLAVVNG